jgi:hypothetical protein
VTQSQHTPWLGHVLLGQAHSFTFLQAMASSLLIFIIVRGFGTLMEYTLWHYGIYDFSKSFKSKSRSKSLKAF